MSHRKQGVRMALQIKRRLSKKFDEEIRFFKGWMARPKAVGAIMPTSSVTAARMASVIDTNSGLPVLELGPGTGVITRAILNRGLPAEKLYAIEYSDEFYRDLKSLYPDINLIHGDAFNIDEALGPYRMLQFDSVISGIPLLNFPMQKRIDLLCDLLERIPAGRPVVQISYGPVSPITARPERYDIQHFDFVVRNMPPAQLWIYRKVV